MRYLMRRIGFYIIALWASITLNFLIPRLAPGNPAQVLMARFQGRLGPNALQALEIQYGITKDPLWVQYVQYINNLLHGNLGISITYFPTPVITAIGQELPWTLALVTISLLLSFGLGTLLGIIIAWKRDSFLDSLLPPVMTFIGAMPFFCLALILVYYLAFVLNWFPVSGGYDRFLDPSWSPDFINSVLQHALLPAITFVLSTLGGWMLGMRNAMIPTLSEDFVLMGEAKGLRIRRVMMSYAARNAILPSITGFAIALGQVVAGQLFIEIVFSYPGIGFSLFQAVQNSDYALTQGIFLLVTVAVLVANFLVDMTYLALDPRVRQERG